MAHRDVKPANILVVTLQPSVEDCERWRCELAGTTYDLLLDVSAFEVIDPAAHEAIMKIALEGRLRGARVLVVGVQPGTALRMAEVGLTLDGIATAGDVEDGMEAPRNLPEPPRMWTIN